MANTHNWDSLKSPQHKAMKLLLLLLLLLLLRNLHSRNKTKTPKHTHKRSVRAQPAMDLQSFLYCAFQAWNLQCSSYMTCSTVKHSLDFSFVFSAPLLAWRNLFSVSRLYWELPAPLERTSQPVTISKKWKNPSSASGRRRTCIYTGPSVIFDLFPRPTHALLLYGSVPPTPLNDHHQVTSLWLHHKTEGKKNQMPTWINNLCELGAWVFWIWLKT